MNVAMLSLADNGRTMDRRSWIDRAILANLYQPRAGQKVVAPLRGKRIQPIAERAQRNGQLFLPARQRQFFLDATP